MAEKEYRKLADLRLWDDNPRYISKENFIRLKKHLQKFGQYKPLIINKDNIVLGGNMRVRAMKELGIEDAWVSVVEADTRAKMLEYALSDNESFGDWEQEQLAELLTEEWTNLDEPDDFKIDQGEVDLKDLLEKFGPSEQEVNLEEIREELVECPACHHKFKLP